MNILFILQQLGQFLFETQRKYLMSHINISICLCLELSKAICLNINS